MGKQVTSLLVMLAMLSYVLSSWASAHAAQDPVDEVFIMDQKILGMQQTMAFFQSLAEKQGDLQLAKKIAQQSAAFFQKNKQLHEFAKERDRKTNQEKVKNHLQSQKNKMKDLQNDYEKQVASYWQTLLPRFTSPPTVRTMATALAADASLDTFEPNDDFLVSHPITSGNLYVSKLSTKTDQDFYRFDSGSMTGAMTVTLRVPSDQDYDLIVMEGPGTVVDFSMKAQVGGTESVTFQVLPNQAYYMVVFSMNGHFSTTSTYTLSLSNVTAVLNLGSPIDMSLPAGEIPAYKFTAPLTGMYRFDTGPYGGFGALNDTVLMLFADEQLQELMEVNDEATDGVLFSEIKVALTKGATYYVYVSHYNLEESVHARLTAALDAAATAATPTIHESAANDGSVTEQQVITLTNGTFASDMAGGVTVNRLPEGLQVSVTRNSDTQITLRFTGKALWHENKHDVSDATVIISKDKVVGAGADVTTNAFGFDFFDTEALSMEVPQDENLAAGQKKIWKFTAPASGTFEIATTYYGGKIAEGTSNTVLAVYEDYSQTLLVASNDDGDQPPFSKLSLPLKSGQDYFVVLSGAGGGSVHARLAVRYLGVEYVYNAKGQLVQIKQNGNSLTEFLYDGNGNLIKKRVH